MSQHAVMLLAALYLGSAPAPLPGPKFDSKSGHLLDVWKRVKR